LAGSDLVRSARSVAEAVLASWPAVGARRPAVADTVTDADAAIVGGTVGAALRVDPGLARWAPPVGVRRS
jgi:hypothetical protein